MNSKSAILIFSRSARAETREKSFVKGGYANKNQKIAEALINRTIATAKQTSLPIFQIDETQQIGSTFGERFANALSLIFDQGFERVVTLGNDCPNLKTDNLVLAFDLLATNHSVIGPTVDNGSYLIGIEKKGFEHQTFANLPWQSAELLDALKDYFTKRNQHTAILEQLSDIDSARDLRDYLASKSSERFFVQLIKDILYSSPEIIISKNTAFHTLFHIEQLVLRGPPHRLLSA